MHIAIQENISVTCMKFYNVPYTYTEDSLLIEQKPHDNCYKLHFIYTMHISQVKVYKHNPNSLKRKLNSECREKGKKH